MLLAALMMVGMLAACADKDENEQVEGSSEVEESNIYDQALSQISADWGEEDFCVLGRNDAANSVTEIHREETSTDPLEDAHPTALRLCPPLMLALISTQLQEVHGHHQHKNQGKQ